MSDDRYETPASQTATTPDYMINTFRNIDRHYKQRKNPNGKLDPTDYTNVIDLRSIESNSSHNYDTKRIITVATRRGGFNGKVQWDWNKEPCFNQDWSFEPSLNRPVTGDGCPPKRINGQDNDLTGKDGLGDHQDVSGEKDDTSNNNINLDHTNHQDSAPNNETLIPKHDANTIGSHNTPDAPTQLNNKTPFQYKKKKKFHPNDQYVHPLHSYKTDYSGHCGSSSSQVYAIDNVPGLFVISRALHYTSQLVWALRCLATYEKDYTNLYNLHFVLPEKGVKDGLESLPNQDNLPDELKVSCVEDIQELFLKACSKAVCAGLIPTPPPTKLKSNKSNGAKAKQSKEESAQSATNAPPDSSTNPTTNNINFETPPCQHCNLSSTLNSFYVHSHTNLRSPQAPHHTPPPPTTSQTSFHTENSLDLVSLKRLRWASLGYHYDWTDREYTDNNKSPFPPELITISQRVIQPLVEHGLVSPLIPEAGIINYYPVGTRMGAHIDDAELAVTCPIVSFSVGLSAVFVIGNKSRKEEPVQIFLRSGDVLIQDGVSRLAFHSVPRIVENSLPIGAMYTAACSLLDGYYATINKRMGSDGDADGACQNNRSDSARGVKVDDSDDTTEKEEEEEEEEERTAASFLPCDTLDHFIELMDELEPMMIRYNVTIEDLLTFLLHVLCEYRINFNTRQVTDPTRGASLAEVRQKFPINAVKGGIYESGDNGAGGKY